MSQKADKLGQVPQWNLTDFYSSISDKNITKDFDLIQKNINNFNKKYCGQVTKLDAKNLLTAIKKYQEICELIGKISSYSYLIYASDLSNSKNLAFHQNSSEKLSAFESDLLFFNLEINKISDAKIKSLLQDQKLAKFSSFIRDVRLFKNHQLEENLEKLALEKSITGRSAFIRLFDETVNNLEFNLGKKTLNSQEIFDLLSSPKSQVRKDAAAAISQTFAQNIKIFAFITNILAKDKDIEDKWRKYDKPISSRNLSNNIEDEIVDTLVKVVKKNYQKISHRYYKIKAEILGLKKLNYWDRNAPLPGEGNKVTSFNDAKNLVLEAYEEFHPKLREIGQLFFDKNWIDAKVVKGKDSGAFSHPCVPSVHPYILMNYQGKTRCIMTLAHELGHGVHQYLSKDQGYLMASTPLTLSETASVFGEQLTFQKILKNEKSAKKKKLIIASKVEDMINTVIRQIAFLEFERKVHDARKKGEISLDDLCKFWMDIQKESLGDAFNFDESYKYFWCYIPHFIHSPFYVYSYAFGDCLVNSLYGIYQSGKIANFEEKYLAMLKLGGTQHHSQMLEPFNLSIKDAKFWQSGLDVIISYINQLESL